MMRFCGFFVVLCLTISTVGGLKCYECVESANPCTNIQTCDVNSIVNFDRCSSFTKNGLTTKSCLPSSVCNMLPISCCEGDLCNNANKYIGPSFFLMVLSSAAYFL